MIRFRIQLSTPRIPLWRDSRFWQIVVQGVVLLIVAIAIGILVHNFRLNLQRANIPLGFDFLGSQAFFNIGETPIPYQPSDSYSRALLVGLVNTLRVTVVGIILATIVGVTAGIARLSDNWLVRHLALVYVEGLRNTPLLLHLLFWYFAVFLQLPRAEKSVQFLGIVNLSNRGIDLPGILQLSPEFSAILLGLTLYTGTFIAEIVRGAIQSVPKGQWEAARALGLKPGMVMRWVIFPQALRVIIPSLTGQYLNLAKNSSLASAIGYPDLYQVSSTTFNQTGRAPEVMLILMVTYLSISLMISWLANLYNRRVQIVER